MKTNNFDFNETYVLENEVVRLEPLSFDHIPCLLTFSINEPEIWKYSAVTAVGEENLRKYIQTALDNRINHAEYPFVVFDKRINEYAGSTRFYDIQLKNQTLQLGYTWYGKKFQGTGLNKNCKHLLLNFAFDYMEIERVEFRADNDNERSKAAMKSIGCQVEGILKSNMPRLGGGRRDSVILSILRSDWYNEVEKNLKDKL